jgi:sugar lactone lactonase YvrE
MAGSMSTGGTAGAGMGGTDPTGGTSGDAGSGGTTSPIKPARAINITPARFFPEGVAVSNAGRFYIGSMDQGDIFTALPDDMEATPLIAAGTGGMISVLGLYVDDATNTLWVCSSDAGNGALKGSGAVAIKAFDLSVMPTPTLKASWDWPAPSSGAITDPMANPSMVTGFCNDMTMDAEGNLYATDSWYPRILRLPAGATAADMLEEWVTSTVFPATQWHLNGIDVDQATNTLYVVENHPGALYRVPIEASGMPGTVTQITTSPRVLGGPDGLKVMAPGLLATAETHADMRGGVSIIDVTGDTATVTEVLGGLDGYATVALAQSSIWVVENQGDHFWGPADNGPDATPPFRLVEIPIPQNVGAGAGTITITPPRFFPEGTTVDATGAFYIGSMEEGSIYKSTGNGVEATQFIAAGSNDLVSVLGLLATDDALWACSSDAGNSPRMGMAPVAIKKFTLADGMPAGSWAWPAYETPHPEAPATVNGFCNDIAIDPAGEFLFATDSWYPRILRLPADAAMDDTIEEWLVDPTFGETQWHLNGIDVDPMGQNLYVVENHPGHLWRVAIAANGDAGMVTEIMTSRPLRGPDGLKVIDMNTLAVAEGSGMAIVELMGDTGHVRTINTGLDGIATFAMLQGSAWLVENQADHFWGATGPQGANANKPFRLVEVPLGL